MFKSFGNRIGKTIAAAYLGGDEPFRSLQPENSPKEKRRPPKRAPVVRARTG
jgi:hypothetical protein